MKKIIIVAIAASHSFTICSNKQATICNAYFFCMGATAGTARAFKEPMYPIEIGAGLYAVSKTMGLIEYANEEIPKHQRIIGPCFSGGYITGYAAARAVRALLRY